MKEELEPCEDTIQEKDELQVTEEQPYVECATVKEEPPCEENMTQEEDFSHQMKEEPFVEYEQPLRSPVDGPSSDDNKVDRPDKLEKEMDVGKKKPENR